jgi:type I restriction enzyme, S subunit
MKRVRVGDVVKLERRVVEIDPFEVYSLIGVYSFGKGIFHREPQPGSDLGDYRFFAVEPGDLVLSNIQAWEGAIAYATDRDRGCIGTHRFLTYVPIDHDEVDMDYLHYYFLSESGHALIQQAAPGSVTRNRTLAIDRFEKLEIPLPDLAEQLRIVARLRAVLTEVRSGSQMLDHSERLSSALPVSAAHRQDISVSDRRARGWELVALRDVMRLELDEVVVDPASVYPNVGILSFGRGLFEKEPIDGAITSAKKLFRIRANFFIYSRLFAFEGAYAVVDERFHGFHVSSEFPSFAVDLARVDPAFLGAYFRSPTVWRDLAGRSKGLGVRRQRVQPEAILDYEVWLPGLDEQGHVARTAALARASDDARSRVRARLDALGAATLNQTFAALR